MEVRVGTGKKLIARGTAIAAVASAFPGLFRYDDLLDMDAREFLFWERAAAAESARTQLRAVAAVSIGMGGNGGRREIERLRHVADNALRDPTETHGEAWNALRNDDRRTVG